MKKPASQTVRSPLTLDRETIRRLSSAELGRAAGGSNVSQDDTGCYTLFEGCTVHGGPKLQ